MDLEKSPITKPKKGFDFKDLKKSLIVVIIFLAIVLLLYVRNEEWIEGLEGVPNSRPDIYEDKNVCKTKECKTLAKRMKSLMNPKINPCDDFYESVCGNYPKNGSLELLKYYDEDNNDLSTFIKTYKPATKSEKIAMTVLEKCMDKSEYRNQIDMSFWNSLENQTLTDVLIEASKVNPINTGFLKNYVGMEHNPATNSKYLFFAITEGLETKSKMKNRYNEILNVNPHLKGESLVFLNDVKERIKFFDVEKYVKNLLPQEYRNVENNGVWLVEENSVAILERIFEEFGVEEVKKVIRKKWESTMNSYLVTREFGECFKVMKKLFPGTLGTIFMKHFVEPKDLDRANKLFKDLQKVFIEMMEDNDWMDQSLKDVLIQEVLDIKASIGYPDEYKNPENMDKMYERIADDFKNQLYLELVQNLLKMNSEETFLRVSRREEITYHGRTIGINANYMSLNHRTSIGPLFLNFPFIDRNLPEWNIFPTLGHVLGHEIGHAFDAQFFFRSPMMTNIKMSIRMQQIFQDRIKCIIQKYNKYQFADGTFSNGTFTQTEDSADMIGFNLAYRLFKKQKHFEKLPYLQKYTVEQQYFQRMGYTWCSAENEKRIEDAKTDVHSLEKFRINGMMSNFEEFAKAFNCPKNSPMNPEKKCPLYK
ncbi:unnamed protein product [Caenorhabditis angaria]|uniref:Peptidase M13 C-terminal domain-containing protein n=1 Tax=Caenorhabditis angaria TaxID=860376 RepID=A0A9P1IBM0_9PELO|nr:unnamed protein product [Caenorhabditis angaria]